MQSVVALFQWLADAQGINVSIVHDPIDRARFLTGLKTTIWLSLLCIGLSIVIGLVGAWLQGARSRVLRGIVGAFVPFSTSR
jgi:polar amino acid transport system permease protein